MKKNKLLNITDILMIAFGAMIGWGWVVSSGSWITNGGIFGTIIAFILGGIMIFFVCLVYAEFNSAVPKGGVKEFSLKSFGKYGSFICTWIIILSYVGVVCFESVSLPTVIGYVFPSFKFGYLYTIMGFDVYLSWILISFIFSALLIVINIIGVKKAAGLQNILTIIIILAGLFLFVASIISGNLGNLSDQTFSDTAPIKGILKVTMVVPFFLFGFDVIPQASEEIGVSSKKTGLIMLLSVFFAVLFYSIVTLSIGLLLNKGEISSSMSATGLVTADAIAKAFKNEIMAKVIIVGGLCGIITSWNSFLIGGSRAITSMSMSRMLPSRFSNVKKSSKSPVFSILLIGVLSIAAPFFGRNMLVWIVDAANFACCLAYCLISIGYLIFISRNKDRKYQFKNKHPVFIGIVSAVLSGMIALFYLIPNTGVTLIWQEWIIVGIWILLGFIFFLISKFQYKDKFGLEIN